MKYQKQKKKMLDLGRTRWKILGQLLEEEEDWMEYSRRGIRCIRQGSLVNS